MREPTISAGFARALLDLAVSKGADRKALAERSGIDPKSLEDQDKRVPLAKYILLMRAGQELSGDPALALHFGEAYEVPDLSIVGLIGMTCETFADAFEQLARFGQLIIDVPVDDPEGRRLVLRREKRAMWMVDTRSNPNAFPELTESSFARMAAASRRKNVQGEFLKEIHVTHAAPSYRSEYEKVFQVPVIFGSDRNALLLTDASFLETKIPNPSRYALGVLSARAETLLKELESTTSTRGRVESLLIPILHKGETGMDSIATKMGLSRQTLLRKLKAEDTTFEKVLDDLRRRLAVDYLSSRKVSVNETAYLVGFSEPAAFSRAFKRWTGTSPRAMRSAT